MSDLTRRWFFLVALLLLASAIQAQESDVSLTVYNNDLALVRDVRKFRIAKGRSEVKFLDVAARIEPTSVFFKSLSAPAQVRILEQNFEYDLVDSQKLLQKYLDQQVSLAADEGVTFSGILLSASRGDMVLRDASGGIKIVRGPTIKNISLPDLPEGLITRPTLVWKLDSSAGGEHKTEVGYLTHGIQWHAEYVGVTNENDTSLELSGWVSIDNRSGATYKNAKLKLVAGDVHRAQRAREQMFMPKTRVLEMAATSDGFEEKSFFEYHLYTLQRPATVKNNQIKQLALFEPAAVKVDKKYIFDGAKQPKKVRVDLVFANSKEAGLGMPLPKGKVRVYKRDSDKSLVLVGEDFVEHTPKDEKVKIYVGDAFDVVGERIQKSRRHLGKDSWEENWTIQLRNHKSAMVAVSVREHFAQNWEILRKSHDYKKKDAHSIEFFIQVPAGGEVTVDYLVRYNR